MKICLFGGTAFLGRAVAEEALRLGHEVTCVARGVSGDVPRGARHLKLDRSAPHPYDVFSHEAFDAVIELTWQPGFARDALVALSPRVAKWCFISSVSVYANHEVVHMDESAQLLEPLLHDDASLEVYGEAKVACELATRKVRGEQCLILRPGLIGGPGDLSDRSGAWVARCAEDPAAALLVPTAEQAHVQVLDVRDLAIFVVRSLEDGLTGTFNTVGESIPFDGFIELSREIAHHHGPVTAVDWSWLNERGVNQWAGPDSLACFVADPELAGWGRVSGDLAARHGLTQRPLGETLADTLVDERRRGLDRSRRAGLSRQREAALLEELAS